MTTNSSHRIFVSYDTREQEWANFVKQALEQRFPGVPTFVAVKDIKPGDHNQRKMLEDELLNASAVIPICSRLSQSSPWLYWEAASAWARGKPYFPLYLGLEAHEFKGGPMNMLQGRKLDAVGLNETLAEVANKVFGQAPPPLLTPAEEAKLDDLKRMSALGALDLDVGGTGAVQEEGGSSLRRVRVTNRGDATVRDVEVNICSISPAPPQLSALPARLQRTHKYEHPFALHSKQETYVDLIWWIPNVSSLFLGFNDTVQAGKSLTVSRYEIEVSVSGEGAGTQNKTFVAEVDATNQFTLTVKA